MDSPKIILASQSPRRKQLLSYLLDDFICYPADIDENPLSNESSTQLVERLARSKAAAVLNKFPEATVIGSDTLIEANELVLGKPKSETKFYDMMSTLSNRWHKVLTGVCVTNAKSTRYITVTTNVKMCEITQEQAQKYWLSGEPKDKAGGYAIQGIGAKFIEKIDGSYSSVVGLPLVETERLIKQVIFG